MPQSAGCTLLKQAKHAWRRASDAAISPVHFAAERERIVVAVAEIVRARSVNLGGFDRLAPDIEAGIEDLLDDPLVQFSLALRRMSALYDAVQHAEYEDARALEEEAACASSHYREVFNSPIASALDWNTLTAVNGPEHYRMADLYSILADAFRPALLAVSDVAA